MNTIISVKDRIRQFISAKRISQAKFEKACGLSNGYVSNLKASPSADKMMKILEAFPELNQTWLLSGAGDMLRSLPDGSRPEHTDVPAVPADDEADYIRYYPNVDGSLGGTEFLDDPDETPVMMKVPGFKGNVFAINAYGDSMYPIIKSGQIVICSVWQETFIDWGRIYLVVTNKGHRAIKRLMPVEGDKERVMCCSENAEACPPFDMPKSDIQHLYIVRGWICREEM